MNMQEAESMMLKLKETLNISEALILSTCNRTEVYYVSEIDMSSAIISLIAASKGLTGSPVLNEFLVLNEESKALVHLFRVSMGLESQVVGDLQITNQVKKAYQQSADLEMAGPYLHRLLHAIFFTNKRVVQETGFRDGAASVSYASAELVEELAAEIVSPKVLVVGLGEMGEDVARNLQDKEFEITLCNRTQAKAESLALECGYKVLPFTDLWQGVKEADIIVSSVATESPLFTSDLVKEHHGMSFKYFLDLSVPRSISKDAEKIPGVLVYNIDVINNRATEALEKRKASVPQVEEIILSSICEFSQWAKEMVFSPTIQKLKNALEDIRQEELGRHMKKLSDKEAKIIDAITKGMMQKIIKLPVLQLKAACRRGEAETLVDVLNDLFNLEGEEVSQKV